MSSFNYFWGAFRLLLKPTRDPEIGGNGDWFSLRWQRGEGASQENPKFKPELPKAELSFSFMEFQLSITNCRKSFISCSGFCAAFIIFWVWIFNLGLFKAFSRFVRLLPVLVDVRTTGESIWIFLLCGNRIYLFWFITFWKLILFCEELPQNLNQKTEPEVLTFPVPRNVLVTVSRFYLGRAEICSSCCCVVRSLYKYFIILDPFLQCLILERLHLAGTNTP